MGSLVENRVEVLRMLKIEWVHDPRSHPDACPRGVGTHPGSLQSEQTQGPRADEGDGVPVAAA